MPRALDPALLRRLESPAPTGNSAEPTSDADEIAAEPGPPLEAPPPAVRKARSPRPTRRPVVVEHRRPAPSLGQRMRPATAELSDKQLGWMFGIEAAASGDRLQISHSELVRFALDRQEMSGMPTDMGSRRHEPVAASRKGSFAITPHHHRWIQQVRSNALQEGIDASQADVIRAALDAVRHLGWEQIRNHLRSIG